MVLFFSYFRRQKKLDEERRLREEKKRQKQEQERLEQQKRIQEQEQRRVQEQVLWQYGLLSFQAGYTKLEKILPKNQHIQKKLLNFDNWCNGEVSKIGHHFRK